MAGLARITWYGHAAFLVESSGVKVLIDPWISNPLSPTTPEKVPEPDYVVITHDHGDHVGDSLKILRRSPRAKVVATYEIAEHIASELGERERSVGANIGGPVKLEGVTLYFTQAVHSSLRGAPAGVVVETSEITAYHAGDTGVFGDMALIGELYRPRVAMLPIGGHFTMGVREAVKAVELLRPSVVVPMHYNTFPPIRADPVEFAELVKKRAPNTVVKILRPGESFEI